MKFLVLFLLLFSSGLYGQNQAPERIGNDMCLTCHDLDSPFFSTPHAKKDCEDCHGPGSEHMQNTDLSLSFTNKTSQWVVERCESCHSKEVEIASFPDRAHGRSGLSCINCHQIHPKQGNFGLLKGPQKVLCVSCHKEKGAQFKKPYHHPVLEGAVKCSDCHSPHDTDLLPVHMGREVSEHCVSCHMDKRGPFVFEHPPLQTDGCMSCHQPHGSVNAKMLKRSDVSQLCLECHSRTTGVIASQPPAFHDIRNPRFRHCTTCHRAIHGSNASPLFLR